MFGDENEVRVFANRPHTHLAGIQVFLKQIRNGKEINHITKNLHFDYDHQYYEHFPKHHVLKKVSFLNAFEFSISDNG